MNVDVTKNRGAIKIDCGWLDDQTLVSMTTSDGQ